MATAFRAADVTTSGVVCLRRRATAVPMATGDRWGRGYGEGEKGRGYEKGAGLLEMGRVFVERRRGLRFPALWRGGKIARGSEHVGSEGGGWGGEGEDPRVLREVPGLLTTPPPPPQIPPWSRVPTCHRVPNVPFHTPPPPQNPPGPLRPLPIANVAPPPPHCPRSPLCPPNFAPPIPVSLFFPPMAPVFPPP